MSYQDIGARPAHGDSRLSPLSGHELVDLCPSAVHLQGVKENVVAARTLVGELEGGRGAVADAEVVSAGRREEVGVCWTYV